VRVSVHGGNYCEFFSPKGLVSSTRFSQVISQGSTVHRFYGIVWAPAMGVGPGVLCGYGMGLLRACDRRVPFISPP